MLGLIVVLFCSWAVIWVYSKEHITVLHAINGKRSFYDSIMGFLIMALFCSINLVGQSYFTEVQYVLNKDYGIMEALSGIWWTFKAGLFEELIFRGVILYILIQRIGAIKACITSAIAFGLYHWFSYGMFGRGIIPMIYVFLVTGAAGWMFAYAFAKSKTILLPLALHLGWIMMSIVVFSDGPLGNSLYVQHGDHIPLGDWPQLLFFTWQALLVPIIITLYIKKNYPTESTQL